MSQPRLRSVSKWTCCRTSRGMVRVCLAWLQSASCPIGRIQSESSGFHAQGKLHEWSDASLRCASRLFLATIFQGTVGWWRHRVLGQSRWASSGGRDGHVSNLDGDRWRRVGAWHWAASVPEPLGGGSLADRWRYESRRRQPGVRTSRGHRRGVHQDWLEFLAAARAAGSAVLDDFGVSDSPPAQTPLLGWGLLGGSMEVAYALKKTGGLDNDRLHRTPA